MDYNLIQLSVDAILKDNPDIKETTLKTYNRQLNKLYNELYLKYGSLELLSNLPEVLLEPKKVLVVLYNEQWDLSENSIKNYLSVIMSVIRNEPDYEKVYFDYQKAFNKLRDSINEKVIQQKPKTEAEEELEHICMDDLEGYLYHHKKRTEGKENKDIDSAMLYMLGHLHLEQVLRNEPATMKLTSRYITTEEDENVNFIWAKNRNEKRMIIRNNKVRNPKKENYKAKEVKLGKRLNTALNKYIQILDRNGISIEDPIPLVHRKKGEGEMSSANYTGIVKKIWAHRDIEMTSTLIRKLYSIEVRKEHNGKILEEKKACEKLDHSKDTHDKNYVIMFD
jgi:hypothetical protein